MSVTDGNFALPCDDDVTVSASVLDPDTGQELVLFTDTIPANTANTCSNKYRTVLPGPDLREVVIQQQNSTSFYLYMFARNGDYFPTQRASMSVTDFLNYVARIEQTKLTVQFSDGRSWSGWSDGFGAVAPWERQNPCPSLSETIYSAKVELRCNR